MKWNFVIFLIDLIIFLFKEEFGERTELWANIVFCTLILKNSKGSR